MFEVEESCSRASKSFLHILVNWIRMCLDMQLLADCNCKLIPFMLPINMACTLIHQTEGGVVEAG